MTFTLTVASTQTAPNTARTGRLDTAALSLETPAFITETSRGAIPHLTPDLVQQHNAIDGVYIALEDFLERGATQAPILQLPATESARTPLHAFTCLPDAHVLVVGPRRTPPITPPHGNDALGIAISTAFGFRYLAHADYIVAAKRMRSDIVVGLADVVVGATHGIRRRDKMFGRTEAWMREMIKALNQDDSLPSLSATDSASASQKQSAPPALFAPIHPLSSSAQAWYLDFLSDPDQLPHLSGLALYAAETAPDLPASLASLPRLSLTHVATPYDILREIALGIDIFTVPFLTQAADAGIALAFTFPAPSIEPAALSLTSSANRCRSLAMDLWDPSNAREPLPLDLNCDCGTCTGPRVYSRAYIHHLLTAKELLAWTLLSQHNHSVVGRFFAGVRFSLARGTFEEDVARFEEVYGSDWPSGMNERRGRGPRTRGYQYKGSQVGSGPKGEIEVNMQLEAEHDDDDAL